MQCSQEHRVSLFAWPRFLASYRCLPVMEKRGGAMALLQVRLVLLGHALGLLPEAIVMAACQEQGGDLFLVPSTMYNPDPQSYAASIAEVFQQRLELDDGRYSEPLAALGLYRRWLGREKACISPKRAKVHSPQLSLCPAYSPLCSAHSPQWFPHSLQLPAPRSLSCSPSLPPSLSPSLLPSLPSLSPAPRPLGGDCRHPQWGALS